MKKKLVIALAVVVAVGGVTVGSIAMNNGTDEQKPGKKVEVVSNQEDTTKDSEDAAEEETTSSEEQSEDAEEVSVASADEEKEEKKADKKKEEKEKKSDKKKSKKEDEPKVASVDTGKKPSTNKPSADKPSSKPSKPSNNTNSNKPSKPNKPSHTHNWVASTKKVYHDAVGHNERVKVKDAWTEKIPRYKDVPINVCNGCGQNITGFESKHNKEHALAGEKGGWHLEYKKEISHYEEVYHEAQYTNKWVVDKPAWTETIVTGYSCSCGAKR